MNLLERYLKKQRGQQAMELLVLLAVILITVIVILIQTSQSTIDFNKQQLIIQGEDSVSYLAQAADDVYRQGNGAKRKVFYIVPQGINESKSGVEGKSFVFNVLGTDVYSTSKVRLTGKIPTSPGGHFIWMTAHENYVYAGTENIEVDKFNSFVTMLRNDVVFDSITVTNNGTDGATIVLTNNWTNEDVDFEIDDESFILGPDESQLINLIYSSNNVAEGAYLGLFKLNVSFPAKTEELTLTANADVLIPVTNLTLFPSQKVQNVFDDTNDMNSFQTCNNGNAVLENIFYSVSGDISSWISGIPNLNTLSPGTCFTNNYYLNVEQGQELGTYIGAIEATDEFGKGENTDSMSLIVSVVPSMSDDFGFDWSTAEFSGAGKKLTTWGITNKSLVRNLEITKMKVRKWSERDADDALLNKIKLKNSDVFEENSEDADVWHEITPFTLDEGESTSINNMLEFTSFINDDEEEFYLVFGFSDGSSYTTTIYTP